MSFATVI